MAGGTMAGKYRRLPVFQEVASPRSSQKMGAHQQPKAVIMSGATQYLDSSSSMIPATGNSGE